MPESFLNHCKTSLSNLIASDKVQSSDDVLETFSEGILNFINHYCHNDHSSVWCLHDKVIQWMYMNFNILLRLLLYYYYYFYYCYNYYYYYHYYCLLLSSLLFIIITIIVYYFNITTIIILLLLLLLLLSL